MPSVRLGMRRMTLAVSLPDALHPYAGTAHRISITWPPGAGKSAFTNQSVKIFRSIRR